MRAVLFAIALIAAACSVVIGVAHWSAGAAWIAAGLLLVVIAYLLLTEHETPDLVVDDVGEITESS